MGKQATIRLTRGLEALETWRKLVKLDREFTLHVAEHLLLDAARSDFYDTKDALSQTRGELERLERVKEGKTFPSRFLPLYWKTLASKGIVKIAKEGSCPQEEVCFELEGGPRVILEKEGAVPEILGLLLEAKARGLLPQGEYLPHHIAGVPRQPYGRMESSAVRIRDICCSITVPIHEASPFVQGGTESTQVYYILVPDGDGLKALALPEGRFDLLSPEVAQKADPRRHPEVKAALDKFLYDEEARLRKEEKEYADLLEKTHGLIVSLVTILEENGIEVGYY